MKKWSRVLVALLRGAALAAAAWAVSFGIDFLGGDLPPALDAFRPWIPFGLMGLRTLEGIIDQARKGPESPERNVVGL
jgi:hypothetical protein